jgi:hypothetical protein
MAKSLGLLGDRLLGLIVPKTGASACRCWYTTCPNGTPRECCKVGGQGWCDPCD